MGNRLHRSNLRVRCALLDRIFCERPSIVAVESFGWDWLVMLKKDNAAHWAMMT